MNEVNTDYLGKHKKFRIDSKKLATVFIVSAFIVAIVVFWWLKLIGITVTGDAFCGLDEHIHSEDCYSSELICGIEESETTSPLPDEEASTEAPTTEADTTLQQESKAQQTTAEEATEAENTANEGEDEESTAKEESTTEKEAAAKESTTEETTEEKEEETVTDSQTSTVPSHIHSDECYSTTLTCTKAEHTHTEECFPDKSADVETVSDWLSTIEDIEITNNIPENLVAIAMSQVGYEESTANFEFDEDGNKNGYTRYGEWYGNPYGNWNTMFVSFCLHYSNINNDSELKAAGAEAMRLAWKNRYAYSPAEEYTPQRGDIVFIDDDSDGAADSTAIILSPDESELIVISGDSNGIVNTVSIDVTQDIIGYGMTDELSFAKDMEYEQDESVTKQDEAAVLKMPSLMMATAPADDTGATIIPINDLTTAITKIEFKTENNESLPDSSTVYIGQTYIVSLSFSEDNTGDTWLQFSHDDDHHLHYQIPENLHCEPFTEWRSITAESEMGTAVDVGRYKINEDGLLIVVFDDGPDGLCFGQRYTNVAFTIDFNATVVTTNSGTSNDIVFDVDGKHTVSINGSADMNTSKSHGAYDEDTHTLEYTLRVEATKGVVKDLVINDEIWENHYVLRDTIVVTDLDGNIIDPQPTIGNYPDHAHGADEGFSISGFPDFAAGDGYLIKYKSAVKDEMLGNETVDMWNGMHTKGKDSLGNDIVKYSDDWIRVELEKMQKDGKQVYIEGPNGEIIPLIQWDVEIRKDNHNLKGTVIIDTLGEGLDYYTDTPIKITHYDESGKKLPDSTIEWKDVNINGSEMSFPLPDGYSFVITYYTTFEDLEENDTKNYTNSVKATINGKEETAGGNADVVGFVPDVKKSARGDDGEYVYFTIEADVPEVIKDWGGFYMTDLAAFWNFYGPNQPLYIDNKPESLVITAVTEDNQTITFTPYVEGGPVENTYILEAPCEDDLYHSFMIYFNTSTPETTTSKWILDKNSTLKITYKLPFDSKTDTKWSGLPEGDLTIEDALLQGKKLSNEVYFNYTDKIQDVASAIYDYSAMITKKSIVHEDGTIDYTVTFNSTIPGSQNKEGYLAQAQNIIFNDTFDERMQYVPGSLTVTCYSPWNDNTWFNKYVYQGNVTGNSISANADDFIIEATNNTLAQNDYSWLNNMNSYQAYCGQVSGGRHVFTYKLKIKDKYINTTEENILTLDNTAELTWNTDDTSGPVTDTSEFKTGLLDKTAIQNNEKLDFNIHINQNALDILDGTNTITVEDTMTDNLSVYWNTIKLYYEDENGAIVDFDSESSRYKYSVTYDQTSNTLTFVLPDELHVIIDYTTLVTESGYVSVSNSVKIAGKAQISDVLDAVFKVESSSGGATGSMDKVMLIKQDGDTDQRLPDVTFHVYGPMPDPDAVLPEGVDKNITTESGKVIGYIGTYTTGADGTVEIENKYLTPGGPYALVESAPPEGYMKLEKPVYFYFYEPDPNGVIQTVTTLIAVENYTYGFVLPETGGTGTLPLAIIGVALMAYPILYSTIRRKRERRLR